MSVLVTNQTAGPVLLAGSGVTLVAGESKPLPYETALRYRGTDGLLFDWANGKLPFRGENGRPKYVNFNSPLFPHSGYGIIGLNAVSSLAKRGVEITVTCPIPGKLLREIDAARPDVMPVLTRRDPFVAEIGIEHATPEEFNMTPAPRRIGWSMWEATRLPRAWIGPARRMERLIVPSSGQVPIWEEVGVPIHVVPDGMGVEDFTAKFDRDPDPEHFTFFSWSRMNSRKCPIQTVDCFLSAFPRAQFPNVRLVMKTVGGHFGMGGMGIPTIQDDRVTIIDEKWSIPQIVDLCHRAHAAVFLSHGEGFANCPTQAMATGLPVILGSHSGMSDQCDERYNYPVGLDPKEPYIHSPLHEDKGEDLQWWQMDYNAVVERMREVYNNRDAAYAKGRKAAAWVREKFSLDVMADGLIDVLDQM